MTERDAIRRLAQIVESLAASTIGGNTRAREARAIAEAMGEEQAMLCTDCGRLATHFRVDSKAFARCSYHCPGGCHGEFTPTQPESGAEKVKCPKCFGKRGYWGMAGTNRQHWIDCRECGGSGVDPEYCNAGPGKASAGEK